MPNDRWSEPPDEFRFTHFERIDAEANERKYYYIAWQQTTLGWGIVRMWGRKEESQHQRIEPATDLASA